MFKEVVKINTGNIDIRIANFLYEGSLYFELFRTKGNYEDACKELEDWRKSCAEFEGEAKVVMTDDKIYCYSADYYEGLLEQDVYMTWNAYQDACKNLDKWNEM